MHDSLDHARGWLRKAESDHLAARRLLDGGGPYDAACFHTQQAVEKRLKAVLAWLGHPILRTHDLVELNRACAHHVPGWSFSDEDASELTPFAVELRYDVEFWPDRAAVEQALRRAERAEAAARAILPLEAYSDPGAP